ncbi:hypothetical protein [Rhizobium sp. FKL33]|uniref:hypothetical protein n=1 Tax=Rhizobium sp. FKL33 TaxID=2562307 RepID=UPI0010C11E85|nr:hypothetical protein [Rhizobium sp. FKL33]
MFSHRVSLIGYFLIASAVLTAWLGLQFDDYFVLFVSANAYAIGLLLIIIGVVVRGFERIETALRASRLND